MDRDARPQRRADSLVEPIEHRPQRLDRGVAQAEMRYAEGEAFGLLAITGERLLDRRIALDPVADQILELDLPGQHLRDVEDIVERVGVGAKGMDRDVGRAGFGGEARVRGGAAQRLDELDRQLAIPRAVERLEMVQQAATIV